MVKRSSAAGSLAKQAKLDLAKDDDKSGKAVGRTSGSSSGDRDLFACLLMADNLELLMFLLQFQEMPP